jgi:hypothetical protein
MHRLTYYEDCIQLDLPLNKDAINLETLHWIKYNPRKDINRFGCSITSLDGSDSGIPDLDSLLEHNILYGTNYTEKDFSTPTKHAAPFLELLDLFQVGRSHYLKLPPGGFFPWHRDNDPITFRILYTIQNCTTDSLIWLEDDRIVPLQNHCWYYINTRKKHALFSFGESVMAVFNVIFDGKTFNLMQKYMHVK